MYTGPKLINDNLVFGYDTGYGVADNITPTKFYKGAPTTNVIHGQNARADSSYTTYSATSSGNWNANHPKAIRAYNSGGGDITGYYNSGVGNAANTHHAHWQLDPILKKPVVVMNDVAGQWKAKSFGTGLGTWTSQGKTHGDTYTISWLQWVDHLSKNAKAGLYTQNTSGSNGFHDGQANSASAYNTKLRTWQRVYQTYTTNSNRNLDHSLASIYMYGHYNVRAVVKVADVQWQWGSIPFPFSETSERSNTDSLIDLKRTTSIDVSNVSFDSTGQPTLDGTDDKIVMAAGSYPTIGTSDFTVDVVFKSTKTSGYSQIFSVKDQYHFSIKIENTGNRNIYVYRTSGLTTYGTVTIQAPSSTDYYHLVCKREGDNLELYLNGVSKGTKSGWNNIDIENDTHATSIGTHTSSGSEFLAGEIPVVRVYNRALTSGEVLQNYNAYKKRFNLQ